MIRILILEDDLSLGTTLSQRLQKDYQVNWAKSCNEARQLISKNQYDVAILDVGLPDGNGFEIATELKKINQALFIFLTAQADAETRLNGFEIGAEEFIPKPFHLKELLIRVKHVIDAHTPQKEIELDNCVISFANMSIKQIDGKIEYPSVTDMKVLQLLIDHSPKPVSRDEIINHVWGIDKDLSHRTIDNTIVRLRQIISDKGEKYIRSVRGIGYSWKGQET